MTLPELEALCVLLRRHDVRVYQAGDVRLELDPRHAAPEAPQQQDTPEMCRCGHAAYAHVNGLCSHGCDVEECAPPEEPR